MQDLGPAFFDNASDAIFVLDLQGRILEVNPAACERLGYSHEELVAMTLADISTPEFAALIPERTALLQEAGRAVFETAYVRRDGVGIPIESSVCVVEKDGAPALLSIARDITARKRAENVSRVQRDLAIALSTASSLDEGARLCLDAAIHVSGMDCGGIYLRDEASGAMDLLYHRGLSPELIANLTHYEADSPSVHLVMAGTPVYARYTQLGVPLDEVRLQEGLRAIAIIPMHYEGRVIGCLNLSSHTLDDVAPLARTAVEAIAAQVGNAIVRLQSGDALRRGEAQFRALFDDSPVALMEGDFSAIKSCIERMGAAEEGRGDYGANNPDAIAHCMRLARVVTVNKATLDLYQAVSVEEFQKRLGVIFGEGSYSAFAEGLIALSAGRTHFEHEAVTRTVRGDVTRVILRWSVAPGCEGNWSKVIISALDIAERRRVEKALRESEERHRLLLESISDGVYVIDHEWRYVLVNDAAERFLQRPREMLLGKRLTDLYPGSEESELVQAFQRVMETGQPDTVATESTASDGWRGWSEVRVYPAPDGILCITRDITKQKEVEEALKQRAVQLVLLNDIGSRIAAVLDLKSELERVVRLVQESFGYHHVAIFTMDKERGEMVMREKAGAFNSLFPPEHRIKLGSGIVGWVGQHGQTLLANDVDAEPRYVNFYPSVIPTRAELSVPILVGGETVGILDTQSPQTNAFDESDVMVTETLADQIAVAFENARLYDAVQQELAERRRVEEALRESEERFRQIVSRSLAGIFRITLDGRILEANPAILNMLGFESIEQLNAAGMESMSAKAPDWVLFTERVSQGSVSGFETSIRRSDGQPIVVSLSARLISDGAGNPLYLEGTFEDITERKRAQDALERYARDLARSNAELQQFAYVASHDLQEPLRMVASYVQLLSRRYTGKLDADADQFIAFAVDGAARMQELIQALLAYSRVGTQAKEFAPTNCQEILENTLTDLQVAIEENGAVVTSDPLPTVMADSVQIGQVLLNLIGNALKFRAVAQPGKRARKPRVHVSAKKVKEDWLFSVRDNGIGIDPRHAGRIFEVFQRLHTRQEYPGTGIGLAICKKIVERHGGRIWLESQPGKGATFFFTIPVQAINSVT